MSYYKEKGELKKLLENVSNDVYVYILRNLESSLSSIGFSKGFVKYFTTNFSNMNFEEFYDRYEKEIIKVYDIGFFQNIVPDYFKREVIPNIPASNVILDVGCGTGILLHSLDKKKFKNRIGIDIHEYPEWKLFTDAEFKVIKENEFGTFLKKIRPDNLVLTWTLHHMGYKEQERYLKNMYTLMKKGSKLVILEDSYAENMLPDNGKPIYDSFMGLNKSERKIVMSIYDWIANRILARRKNVPIPFGYRTLEEWEILCEKLGYRVTSKKFIGFPNNRDINTPQSILIIEK